MDEKKKTLESIHRYTFRKNLSRVIKAGVILVLVGIVGVVGFLSSQPDKSEETVEKEKTTATAEVTSLIKYVFGSGTASLASTPKVFADTDGDVETVYVKVGDSVKAGDVLIQLKNDDLQSEADELENAVYQAERTVYSTKTHDMYEQRQLTDSYGNLRYDPVTGEAVTGKFSNEISVIAPSSGRIMAIYIQPGDDALAVYRDKGSVMMISTDGRMKVKLTDVDGSSLTVGDKVRVAGDGCEAEGTVVSLTRRGRDVSIQVMSDEYPMDLPVSVSLEDGTLLGEGILEINKPMAVSSYGGIVKGLTVKVGDMVKRQDILARYEWDWNPLYIDNDSVQLDYLKATEDLENAREKLDALLVVAPCDGVVSSVSVKETDKVKDGNELLQIAEFSEGMEVVLSVDEMDIINVQEGQKVIMTADALPDETFTGTVKKIAPIGTSASSAKRGPMGAMIGTHVTNYSVTIQADSVDERLLGGMNVSGQIAINTVEDALVIPTDALIKKNGTYHVTMADGTLRDVELGVMTDDYTQILSGLSEGEKVVY